MEDEMNKLQLNVNDLKDAVHRISQFAVMISNRLSSQDKKLDAILSKLTNGEHEILKDNSNSSQAVTSKNNTGSENLEQINLPQKREKKIRKSNSDATSISRSTARRSSQLTPKTNNSKETLTSSSSSAAEEIEDVNTISIAAFLPFNLSAPSIPNLVELNVKPTQKKLTPCKSSPILTGNVSLQQCGQRKSATVANVVVSGKDDGAKTEVLASQSTEQKEHVAAPVSSAPDPQQTQRANNNSNILLPYPTIDVLCPSSANSDDRTEKKCEKNREGALDKKRSNSTIVSPGLTLPKGHQRRASYSGISATEKQNKNDMTPSNMKLQKSNEIPQVESLNRDEIPCKSTENRNEIVQRQSSSSSTATSHSGIDIVMGDDSTSDEDEIEIKLKELPSPIFSHRTVSLKRSTYKHFYDLKEPIGGGRFGRVHRCVEKKTGLQLAAKCFLCKKQIAKPLLKAKSLQRAQNLKTKRTQQEPVDKDDVLMEIAIMNQIDHDNIVKLYDAYENDNTMTLILEYLGGGELFERVIADQSQLTELDAVLFMKQIVTAVQYLHKNLILHLDLKPENILCLDRSTHHIKIIDFGLARKYQPRQKLFVQWGTPEFMAPEMFNYGSVSFPSDMWSIGIICYILLSGISPFLGEDDNETTNNIRDCEWDFEEEPFLKVSEEAKDFISRLLVEEKSGRMSAAQCLRHEWLATPLTSKRRKTLMNKNQLKSFMVRMQWKASVVALCAANWLKQKVGTVAENVLTRDVNQ